MIPRAAIDYILLQLKTKSDSYITNRLLLNVDMTIILLIKVDLYYDDDNAHTARVVSWRKKMYPPRDQNIIFSIQIKLPNEPNYKKIDRGIFEKIRF